MNNHQPGILELIPPHATYLFYHLIPGGDAAGCLQRLADIADGTEIVVGLGQSLIEHLEAEITGIRTFPERTGAVIDIVSTPFSLMCWLRGDDPGKLLDLSQQVNATLEKGFVPAHYINAFKYGTGQDLTGYEDGTENPNGQEALDTAFVSGAGPGLDGSSFVAVQQWLHDFDALAAMTTNEADNTIGRRLSDNVELEHAPECAHVKRTAQESFEPEAFMLRRSMAWSIPKIEGGLFFSAFGNSFNAFEAQLARMLGEEDGITDALFKFTCPINGAYFWCPPMVKKRLDFRALKL